MTPPPPPLDPDVLVEARLAKARHIALTQQADQARAALQDAIRRLNAGGASLREIADALEMSHQRVHQIVGTIPEGSPKGQEHPHEIVNCSFCGKSQKHVAKLIAGPGVYICGECIPRFESMVAIDRRGEPRVTCSFCAKGASQVKRLVQQGSVRICNECIDLCREILSEE